MDRLLAFLKSNIHHLLFVLLEVVALLLLFSQNRYNRTVLVSTANRLSGEFTKASHVFSSYQGLSEENVRLMRVNAELERELQATRHQLMRLSTDTLSWKRLTGTLEARPFPYEYKVAQVVGNTAFGHIHSLTIDIGRNDGVLPDMGVVSSDGVVGVVVRAGQRYAQILPLINPHSFLSCKLRGSEHVGTLNWDGSSPEYSRLMNLPKHLDYNKGDSVFTSGYSAIFPAGLLVGTVVGETSSPNDNFIALSIKLATTFNGLKYVYVLKNHEQAEHLEVQMSE